MQTKTHAPSAWAPNVLEVPILHLSSERLEDLSTKRGLGFSASEFARVQRYFRRAGREPTDVELVGLAQSWSEHCSYKSSKRLLQSAFARLHPKPRVLGTGDAGVLRLDHGLAYALRIESHNHPSAVEPYGGAATGIGGILRDVLAVGARPIALSDPLFFGPLDLPASQVPAGVKSPRYLMGGVVAGIRDYGNRVGVPTVSGGIYFDPDYVVNPLVNVGCVGLLPRQRLRPNRAQRPGNRLVLVGGLTGRDGIGGVAFASKELNERSEAESRGAVQLGNPIMKEPLITACIEAFDRKLVQSVKDLGGGGLATASGELVHAGGWGSRLDLARVPLREAGLKPWEIWISESQERMLLEVRPKDLPALLALFARHDVPATDLGEVTRSAREEILYEGRPAAELSLEFRVEPPLRPAPKARGASRGSRPALEVPDEDIAGLFESLVLAPDSRSRESVIRVYDHEVQGRTVVKSLHGRVQSPSHGDAAVLQARPERWTGLAITTAAQPWTCRENPRVGGAAVVEEAARNLYAVGARPDAFTNCLNFGNPNDPKVLGDFAAVVAGLAEAAQPLGFAVPSGNVSFYNGGLGAGIPPTPVLMATGIVPDLRRAVTSDLKEVGDRLYLVGPSLPQLGGSLFARMHGRRADVPAVDPRALRRAGDRLLATMRGRVVRAVHDVSDGGLAVTLAEMAFGGGAGFSADLTATGLTSAGLALSAEGGSRWVVEVPESHAGRFERLMRGTPLADLGIVTEQSAVLRWGSETRATIDLGDLYDRWRGGFGLS